MKTPEDDELTLRVYRSTLIFMTYYNAFDYFRLILMLAGIIYCHLALKQSARLHSARLLEAGGQASLDDDSAQPCFRGDTHLHRFLG